MNQTLNFHLMAFHYNTVLFYKEKLNRFLFCLMAQTILTPEEMAFSPSAADTEAKMLFLLTVIKWVSAKKAEQKAATANTNQGYEGKKQAEQKVGESDPQEDENIIYHNITFPIGQGY